MTTYLLIPQNKQLTLLYRNLSKDNHKKNVQLTLLMENLEALRTNGDLEGKSSLRRFTAGEPGGVMESESRL